jgi:hypothetical protein
MCEPGAIGIFTNLRNDKDDEMLACIPISTDENVMRMEGRPVKTEDADRDVNNPK